MWKTIVIFWWSQELTDVDLSKKISLELEEFLYNNKQDIDKILYWWWVYWVMKTILDVSRKVGISIEWYSLLKWHNFFQNKSLILAWQS